MDSHYLAALGTIIGTIVGAGILALPYAVSKSGFLIGLILLIVVGVAATFLTLYTGELSFRSKKIHQLPILISEYTNKRFRIGVLLIQIATIYGSLIAYLIGMGASLDLLIGIPSIVSIPIIFVLTAPLILKGYASVENAETPLAIIKILLILAVSVSLLLVIHTHNLTVIHPSKSLFSFGVVLFSLTAFTVVPEVKAELEDKKEKFNSVVLVSIIISIAIYIIFSAAFVGAFGANVSAIATNSVTSNGFSYLYYIVTIFILLTPYLALSLVMVDSFNYDFKFSRKKSFAMAMFIPLALSLTGLNFAYVLDVIGGLFLPILALMVLIAVVNKRRLLRHNNHYYKVPGGLLPVIFTGIVMIVGLVYTLVYII